MSASGTKAASRKRVSAPSEVRRRLAAARALRVLRSLRQKGVEALVVGSLAEGRFGPASDVDFLVVECPPHLRYRIEAGVEDVMLDIPFDVVYRDEARESFLKRMEATAIAERELVARAT